MSLMSPEAIESKGLGQLRNHLTPLGLSADVNGSGKEIQKMMEARLDKKIETLAKIAWV